MKDYAKRSTKPARHHSSDGAWFSTLMLVLAVLFAGFAGVHLIEEYVASKSSPATVTQTSPQQKTHNSGVHAKLSTKKNSLNSAKTATEKTTASKPNTNPNSKKTTLSSSQVNASSEKISTTDDQPKFDFYKLLPQMTVNVPTDDDAPLNPALANTKPTIKPASPTYVLQVAALQHKKDAAQVQSSLKSAGYSTFLQAYSAPDHTTWYRVLVGPFNNLKKAQAQQDKLDAEQTEALLTTLKN